MDVHGYSKFGKFKPSIPIAIVPSIFNNLKSAIKNNISIVDKKIIDSADGKKLLRNLTDIDFNVPPKLHTMQKRIGSMELMSQCPQYSPYRRHYEITALMSPGNQSALKGINGNDDCVTKNKPYRRGNSMIKLSSNLMNVDKKQLFNKNNYVISNSINKSQSIDSAFDKYDILLNLDTDENNVNTSIDINDFELISMDDIDILRGVIDDVNVPENIVDDFDILYEKKLFETDFKDEKINCLDDFIDDNTEMILNDDYSHAMEQSSQILKKTNIKKNQLS